MNFSKRGKVTIWVIVAVAIVAVIGFIFFISGRPTLISGAQINPNSYIDTCMKDAAAEALEKMLPQGGFVDANGNSKMHDDIDVSYLCYTSSYYFPCINQHPAYLNELKNEIVNYVQPRTEQCFNDMKTAMEKQGYSVTFDSPVSLDAEIMPEKVRVSAARKMSAAKQGTTQAYSDFEAEIPSSLFELANVAVKIVNDEAQYCTFGYVGYMAAYPQFDIQLDRMSDSTKIYTIKDLDTNNEMNIAIRGCASAPGF